MANPQEPKKEPGFTPSHGAGSAQNVMLTIKLLVGASLLIGLFWLIDRTVS